VVDWLDTIILTKFIWLHGKCGNQVLTFCLTWSTICSCIQQAISPSQNFSSLEAISALPIAPTMFISSFSCQAMREVYRFLFLSGQPKINR